MALAPAGAPPDVAAARGMTRLALDAAARLVDVVESMHYNIARAPAGLGQAVDGRTRGITGLVYQAIRTSFHVAREGLDQALSLAETRSEPLGAAAAQEAFRAALNGVVGDHLAATGNPLALPMRFRRHGRTLELDRSSLAAALPDAGPRVLVLVHGLCMNDRQWRRLGHDHGEQLAADRGDTPVYLHYNSGRHVSANGREFAALLEQLLAAWPVPVSEIAILAHSLGGLVARSALHYAAQAKCAWPQSLRRIVFLGTPHHGAPLERGGNWLQTAVGVTPYAAPLARLGMLRSAAVTDLRHGNLLDEDCGGDRFRSNADTRRKLPLPAGIACYAAAATLGRERGDIKDRLLADGLVPVGSAFGRHADADRDLGIPAERRRLFCRASHWDLLSRADVYAQLRDWLA